MRLDKFVCKSTRLTRAQATAMIADGCVVVNDDVICDVATQVHEDNHICLNGDRLTARASHKLNSKNQAINGIVKNSKPPSKPML